MAFGLDQAILIGVALSILLFVPRAAKLKATELVVDTGDVVRGRHPAEPPNRGFLIDDFEGERFFGPAPELDRTFARIEPQSRDEGVRHVVLRLKRVRNPDVVCLEHFLKRSVTNEITVWPAGLQPASLQPFRRLGFPDWLPDERLFREATDDDSATLGAVRSIRALLPERKAHAEDRLYYLV